ncbi:nuclear transport factor 2 family protein [Qipengyuania soli]|uniref:Nuclear transport factor 2 family protein n=1 Tax=Qipengyuania soli TaxID=2782568 RepID=A0A7S8F5N9_9SPHN|nr:nuclear transport factor 2 family protein [Qipengyuania soli]QPC99654.1 nuclear transport factor 2 family protein [Qipengyuania soli]
MNPAFDNLDRMLAIWNSDDAEEKRRLADLALEHNVHFADPNHNIVGRDAFLAMAEHVQKRIPGAIYSRASRIDVQNNFCRYHWAIDLNGQRLMDGFDMTEVNDSGRIVKVIGFFGKLEGDASSM